MSFIVIKRFSHKWIGTVRDQCIIWTGLTEPVYTTALCCDKLLQLKMLPSCVGSDPLILLIARYWP